MSTEQTEKELENSELDVKLTPVIEDDGIETNKRYLNLARKLRNAGFVLLFVLILFVLGMFIVFREDITYENFNYMFRDLDTVLPEYTGQRGSVYFDAAGDKILIPFRGSLGIVSPENVAFYNLRGNNTYTDNVSMISPMATSSVKYLLVYDLGGTRYKLYNGYTFSEGEEYEFPITCGAVADNGVYAIASRNLQYRTVVDIYNENFHKTSTVYKDRYLVDLKINKTGDKIMILTVNGSAGEFNTEICIVSPKGDEPLFEEELKGVYATECNFFANDNFSVLTDNGLMFYNSSFNYLNTYGTASNTVMNYITFGNYAGVVYSKNIVGYDSEVFVLNSRGEVKSEQTISGEVLSVAGSDNGFYFLHNGTIERVHFYGNSKDVAELPMSPNSIVIDNGNLIVGFSGSAVIYPENGLFYNPETVSDLTE